MNKIFEVEYEYHPKGQFTSSWIHIRVNRKNNCGFPVFLFSVAATSHIVDFTVCKQNNTETIKRLVLPHYWLISKVWDFAHWVCAK